MSLNFAHRGFSAKYPENTMLAFRKAREAGADGIELDVQLSRDGEVMIMHDETLKRTCAKKGLLKDYTAAELRRMNAAHGWDCGFQPIPTLREYFSWVCATDLITNIEMKTSAIRYPGIEEKVIGLIREFRLADQVILSSFKHETIRRMQALMPELRYGYLMDSWAEDVLDYLKQNHLWSFHPNAARLNEALIRALHREGIRICCYTVNEIAAAKRLQAEGVEVIISNECEMMHDILYGA